MLLPDLYHFDVKTIGKAKRWGPFKTKGKVDPKEAERFLPWIPFRPKQIDAELVISWPVTDKPSGSQLWHRDLEAGKRCFRALVYLSDVTINDGPFCYAPGTRDLKASNRMTDEEFEKVVPRDKWQTFTGPKGTTIIFDILDFHRGLPNVSGKREALVFTYK